jgi:putative acetyltransferase
VTVDPKSKYLDQIVVRPEGWGSGVATSLLDEAKRLSPGGIELLVNKDNLRAIRFYEKNGFAYSGEGTNPVSGKVVNKMAWRP